MSRGSWGAETKPRGGLPSSTGACPAAAGRKICAARWRPWKATAWGPAWPWTNGGLDFKRTVFLALMERIENRDIAHRDRLARFGCDWFEPFAQQHGCTLTVVNQASLSPQAEMVEDLMAIVQAFSGRLYGLRSYPRTIREAAGDGR